MWNSSEVPKSDKSFEERLIFKTFILKFANAFTPIVYLAFFRGRSEHFLMFFYQPNTVITRNTGAENRVITTFFFSIQLPFNVLLSCTTIYVLYVCADLPTFMHFKHQRTLLWIISKNMPKSLLFFPQIKMTDLPIIYESGMIDFSCRGVLNNLRIPACFDWFFSTTKRKDVPVLSVKVNGNDFTSLMWNQIYQCMFDLANIRQIACIANIG